MSAPTNTQIVQQAYAAFGRGDIPALLSLLAEDVDWHPVYGAGPNVPGLVGMVVGFLFTTFLTVMRLRFVWWPFHPLGYVIAADWTVSTIWMPLILGWAAKAGVMRYGGPRAYRSLVPFALGLILGEFVLGGFWSTLAFCTHTQQYAFWQF